MNDIFLKKLNSTDAINNALPRIIEAFVTFYGEEERSNIEEKFNNMVVIGYCSPDNVNSILIEAEKTTSNEMIEDFSNKLNVPLEKRDEFKEAIFGGNHRFNGFEVTGLSYNSLHPLNHCIEYINGSNRFDYKNDMVKILNFLNINATIDNVDEFRNSPELNNLITLYNDTITKFKDACNVFSPYRLYVEKCKELENELYKKYYKLFINEFKELFSNDELFTIEQEFNKESYYLSDLRKINGKVNNLLDSGLLFSSFIEAFSTENEELLNGNNKFRSNSIKNDRIIYFKNLGLDLGNNYDTYLSNENAKNLIPSSELIDKVTKVRNHLKTLMKNEYYQSLEEYKHNVAMIEAANLVDKDHGYDANAYETNSTFICPNIKETENGVVINPILALSMGGVSEYLDHSLIHELNHIFELNLKNCKGNRYSAVCGWDLIDGVISNETSKVVDIEEREEKRNYELFNEIINELISQEITDILFESNGYIFNTEKDAKSRGGSSYEKTKFLVSEFYENYKAEIIDSRKTGDMSNLFNTVGKNNFEALNNLFHIFDEMFPGYTFFRACNDFSKGIDSEDVKKLKYILEEKNNIMTAMYEQSNKKVASL